MYCNKNKKESVIRLKLLKWYTKNYRKLPWRMKGRRNLLNPYKIMVSEFMLQQTTVNTVIPKFNEFIKIWPNLKKLSMTKESKILKFWSGLGYYARARNLLKSTKLIAKDYKYIVPDKYNILIQLPGIGDYTAKAILGIAYNKPVIPIDTNIKRIVSRIYAIKLNRINSQYQIIENSKKLISKKTSSNFIQSLMDYGSIVCTTNQPKCNICIIKNFCKAFEKNIVDKINLKKVIKHPKPKKITRAYLIENEFNEILVNRRPPIGMLQSMIQVPNDEWVIKKNKLKKNDIIKSIHKKFYKLNNILIYSFTHFDLEVEIYFTKINKKKYYKHNWLSLRKIDNSGMPTIMKKIVKLYLISKTS